MDLEASEYESVQSSAFSHHGAFVTDTLRARSTRPATDRWVQFESHFPRGPVLEIGPGTGHFLAAARDAHRDVYGVEPSALHRDFIARTWGIHAVVGTIADLPPSAPPFAAVVMFNTIEHVFDLAGLFESIRPRLQRDGVVFVSTCNADCIILGVVGVYWSMFKPEDHVSIPSAEGFRRLAGRTGYTCASVWTGERPLETPIGLAVALRDWARERGPHARAKRESGRSVGGEEPADADSGERLRGAMRSVVRWAEHVDPTRHWSARIGRAATIRGVFRIAPQ